MDLQGSRTHILPLNLLHQNSLYFIEDQQLASAYAASLGASSVNAFKAAQLEAEAAGAGIQASSHDFSAEAQ